MKQVLHSLQQGFQKKKVLLSTLSSPFLDNSLVFPYLGILYLCSVAKGLGFKTRYIGDWNTQFREETLKNYDFFYTDTLNLENISCCKQFHFIALSCLTPQATQAYRLLKQIKKISPRTLVAIGGPHTKGYRAECIEHGFDIVSVGDGERVFSSLLTGDVESLRKLLHPSSTEKTLVLYDKLPEKEMNRYPVPLREEAYVGRYKYLLNGTKATTLINSRGCFMKCEFCEDRLTGARWYSPEHFTRELESVVTLGINAIMIFDDLFALNPKKVAPYLSILERYHKKHGFIFRCFGHSHTMSAFPQMASMLARAGCVEIGFGAESASQAVLDRIGKGTRIKELHDFVNTTVAAGINVKAFFMIGLPGETPQTFNETYEFIKEYRDRYPDHFDFDLSAFFPYKGTKIGHIVRLEANESITIDGKVYTRHSVPLRPAQGLTWEKIDNGNFGAYKKRGGESDIVVEAYDWKTNTVALSAEKIFELKEKTMLLSARYTDKDGKRIFTPSVEGSIGSIVQSHDFFVHKKLS